MSYEKVIAARLATVGTQVTDLQQPIGGASGSGTATGNPLSSEAFWTSAAMTYTVGPPATGISGTWTLTVQGTINGCTAIPFARISGITDSFTGTTVFNNLFNSPGIPTPQYVNWDSTAGAVPGITGYVSVIAKTIRGKVRGSKQSSFSIYQGRISSVSGDYPGSGVNGITVDKRHLLAANSTSTTPSVWAGLDRFYLWDSICYAVDAKGVSGNYVVRMEGLIDGNTVTLARSPAITGVTRVAMVNTFYGCSPRPTAIFFDETTGGAIVGLTADVHYMAVATRGVRHKT